MKFPLALAAAFAPLLAFSAEIPRALPPGQLPNDARLGPLKELDGYFPWTPPASPEVWAPRAEQVRMQLRVALGVWPEPTRTPLNAVVHGLFEGDGYTVEKVSFESMPGFFVTGNLYRPSGGVGPYPAVLCPHGHWTDARFALRSDEEMKKELESGGERFAESGRSMFQSLGVQLARMGVVAFVYDMLGYCDSQQIGYDVAHKFAKQRPEANTVENWALFSPQAEAHVQSIMGLQTWNAIRALDFLCAQGEVDITRLGCTGASGGGTQTMLLSAIDSRITVECPAVMVSTAMQGGCTCENCSLLRIGTGNVEFAALFAPKPLGMTAANDWTKEMETKGFPELQKHYATMGAPQNVALWPHLNFPHNYNIVSREHIYGWFNEHFHLGLTAARLSEQEYPPLPKESLSVWDEAHPAPVGGIDFERKLLRWWHDDAQAQMATPNAFRQIALPAWRAIIGSVTTPTLDLQAGRDRTNCTEYPGLLRTENEAIPFILLKPKTAIVRAVVWLDERGKAGLYTSDGELRPEVQRMVDAGSEVIGADLFLEGEFLGGSPAPTEMRVPKNPRESAAYTFGYNHSVFAQRVRDVLRTLAVFHGKTNKPMKTGLVALGSVGPIGAAAFAIEGEQPADAAVIDISNGFRFGSLLNYRDANFLPGAAKYGDVAGLLELAAPRPLYLLGKAEGQVISGYRAAGAEAALSSQPSNSPSAAIDWLIEHTR